METEIRRLYGYLFEAKCPLVFESSRERPDVYKNRYWITIKCISCYWGNGVMLDEKFRNRC